MKTILTGAILLVAALMPASELFAAGALPNGPYVIATGKAKTDIAPDNAVVTFSVEALAPTTSAASKMIDQKSAKIFATLKNIGIADEDIRASTLDVSPRYDYVHDKRVFSGQDLTRNFRVTLNNLKKFSNLIKGLLNADVDQLNYVDFGSSKEAEIKKHNMETAIDNARKLANDMATRAGEHIDRIYGMAPGEYSDYITQDFPMEYRTYGNRGLASIEVTGTRIKGTDAYIIPKSITFSTTVTIVCSVK